MAESPLCSSHGALSVAELNPPDNFMSCVIISMLQAGKLRLREVR